MCEPNHSIVQYPDKDPDRDDRPTGDMIDAIPTKEGWWEGAKKKIGSWFHFSKFGLGHSEAIGALSVKARHMLPCDTKYEARWWDRHVERDGWYSGHDFDQEDALKSATLYANSVSIGNLTLLRQFLERSMRKSDRFMSYVEMFPLILNGKGKDAFTIKLRRIGNQSLETLIKVMMGFTRKRGLLVPEWADDQKLWLP